MQGGDASFEWVKCPEHNLSWEYCGKVHITKRERERETRAPQNLKGSNVWVNEQFPPEIEETRKKLYLIMRLAKRD